LWDVLLVVPIVLLLLILLPLLLLLLSPRIRVYFSEANTAQLLRFSTMFCKNLPLDTILSQEVPFFFTALLIFSSNNQNNVGGKVSILGSDGIGHFVK
jgi:hypothetical protein